MFDTIPVVARRDQRLNSKSVLLLGLIISLSRSKLGCIATNRYLSKEINVSVSSLKRYLVELKEYEYVVIENIQRQDKQDIRVIVPNWNVLPGISSAVKHVHERELKENRKPFEPDWIDEVFDEL
jgi:hypothetical protein